MRLITLFMLICAISRTAIAQEMPIVFPVPGATSELSAGFFDKDYFSEEGVQHLGADIPSPSGTEVVSPVDGTVILNKTDVADPFSAYLVIRSKTSGFEHVLAHIRSDLKASTAIMAGEPVGQIVTAGTGPHLHYGINQLSVAGALDIPAGWGFGRAPASATAEEARARGWLDPEPFLSGSTSDDGQPDSFEWNTSLIAGVSVGRLPCGEQRDSESCLRGLGFGDQAIAFSYAMDGDYSGATVGMSFTELGAVDLATGEFIGADTHYFPVLLNGSVSFQRVDQSTNLRDVFFDNASQKMLRRFPNAFADGMDVRSHRVLKDGNQRFVLVERVVDGCRACDIIGAAVTFLEVGPATGGNVVPRPIGLLLGTPDETADEMTAELLFSKPDSLQVWLNSLGYEAGPMDGRPGRQTGTALLEFQADYCLTASGVLDDATAEALLSADGFKRPCAGKPVGIAAEASQSVAEVIELAPGTYVTDTRFCSDPNSAAYGRDVRILGFQQVDHGMGEPCFHDTPILDGEALEYAAHCPFSEAGYVATWRWRPLGATVFVEERGLFPNTPDAPWGLQFSRCP